MFDCYHGRCPKYFFDVYTPVHTVAARSRLRSADHGDISSSHVHGPLGLAAQFPRVRTNGLEQTSTASAKYRH